MPEYKPPATLWAYDKLQFARLIAEAQAAGFWDHGDPSMNPMLDSMDLDQPGLRDLVDRAEAFWDTYKQAEMRPLARPLTAKEAAGLADEDGFITGVVSVDVSALVDNDLEGVLDLLGEALVDGGSCLSDINYVVVGQQDNTLYVEVSGDASYVIDEEETE